MPSDSALQPPRRISHLPNLLWWAAVVLVGLLLYHEDVFVRSPKPTAPPRRGTEHESFLALSFGKLGEEGPDVIPAPVFRDQLSALKSAGYTPVSLHELEAFYREGTPLPDRPVLLMFDGVQRESTEIADAALASQGFHGIAFADVDALSTSNIDLVSTHRLRQMVDSGRWAIGIASCNRAESQGEGAPVTLSLESLRKAREQLGRWTGHPVSAASCERFLGEGKDEQGAWRKMMADASLAIGFVVANPGANYVDDSPYELRRLRVSRDWKGEDLLTVLDARVPKKSQFHDDFDRAAPSPSWIVDRGELTIDKGALQFAARPGDNGALLTLAGSERWADAEVEVGVDRVSDGQLWVSLRSTQGAFVRLGVVSGRAVLQQLDSHGETHDMGSRDLPKGRYTLKLQLMGARAIASVDGVVIGDRPTEIPSVLRRGPLAIAIWDPDGSSSARISRVVAKPLRERVALVVPRPGEVVWEELRRGVGDIALLSPKQYTWSRGRSMDVAGDAALAIFARHNRLDLMPAVTIEADVPLTKVAPLREQLAHWAKESGVDGLNLVVGSRLAADFQWQQMVTALRKQLEPEGRRLAVTVAGVGEVPGTLPDLARTFALPRGEPKTLQIAEGALTSVGPTL